MFSLFWDKQQITNNIYNEKHFLKKVSLIILPHKGIKFRHFSLRFYAYFMVYHLSYLMPQPTLLHTATSYHLHESK